MASIAFFVEVLHAPLCNTCAVPATTLKHDQVCIRHSACLMFRLVLARLPLVFTLVPL